ncbi:hypothetical protein ACVIGA_009087 [Bradyrhizobium sp. USDA 3240]
MGNSLDNDRDFRQVKIDLTKLELSVDWLPQPDKDFQAARRRWMNVVRASKLLTGAERQIGLAIAQEYINRQPGHQWYNWAWPSHQTLADKTGLSRRTVVAGIKRLVMFGFLMITHGGGRMGRGGRTDRYTLRMDRLELLASFVASRRVKGVKKLHTFKEAISGKPDESCAKGDAKLGNLMHQDVKGLHTTLPNTQLQDSITEPFSLPTGKGSLSSKGKQASAPATSVDYSALARCVGEGDVAAGWERLQAIPESEVDLLALRLRKDPSQDREIRREFFSRRGNALP